jgi:hypothetical protein
MQNESMTSIAVTIGDYHPRTKLDDLLHQTHALLVEVRVREIHATHFSRN